MPEGRSNEAYSRNVTHQETSIMTELFEHRYYKINKFLLSIVGQWPYQNRTRRHTLLAIFLFIVASQIIPQTIALVEFWDNPEIVIESIPPFVIIVACGTKLTNVVFNSDKMLKLADRMEIDWTSLTDKPEIHVLHEYAEIGRRFTIAYAAGVYATTVLFMTQPVVPQILDALKLTNMSQPKQFPFPIDYYGIDLETYYCYFVVHSFIGVGAIVTAIIAIDTMFVVHVQHACGMFTVVGHQMEQMGTDVSENFDIYLEPSRDPSYKQLATCNKNHSEAIEFADLLESSYTWSFFSLVGFNMLVISVTGFQTVMMLDESLEEAIRYAVFTVAQMVHLFFQSFFSQNLMDHSEQVRDYMYQAEWYKASVCAQKLLNLVIMRTYVPCQLTAGKCMVMSLDNFTSIVKTSMSYFTLLRSMQ